MRTGFALFVKRCEVPELLFAVTTKLLMKEEKVGKKRMTYTENTLEIYVFRADDLLPFQTSQAIKNIINGSPEKDSFPFQVLPLAIFTLQFPPPFLVFRSGFEYISAKLNTAPKRLQ